MVWFSMLLLALSVSPHIYQHSFFKRPNICQAKAGPSASTRAAKTRQVTSTNHHIDPALRSGKMSRNLFPR